MRGYCTLNSDASVDMSRSIGGYAIWIKTDFVTIKHYDKFKIPVDDANKAEIMAVINGIHLIVKNNIPLDTLVINTDNQMCRDIVNKKRDTVPDSFLSLYTMLREACEKFPTCYAKKIKGHTKIKSARHHVNRWCDEHAKKARCKK